jgi:hypothetical protein
VDKQLNASFSTRSTYCLFRQMNPMQILFSKHDKDDEEMVPDLINDDDT